MKRSLSLLVLALSSSIFAGEAEVQQKGGTFSFAKLFKKFDYMLEVGASGVNKNYSMENNAPETAIVGGFFNGYSQSSAYSIKKKNDNPYFGEFVFAGSAFVELDNGWQVIGRLFFGSSPDLELYRPLPQTDVNGNAITAGNAASVSEWNQPKKATLKGHFKAAPAILVGDGRNFFGLSYSMEKNRIVGNDPLLADALDGEFEENIIWLIGRTQRKFEFGGGNYFVAFETSNNFLETLMGSETSDDMKTYITDSHRYSFDAVVDDGATTVLENSGSGYVQVKTATPSTQQRITVKSVHPFHSSGSITIGKIFSKADEEVEPESPEWFF